MFTVSVAINILMLPTLLFIADPQTAVIISLS